MSVIRQPEVLGQTTRRRVVGVTAALSATAVETLAVGLWFGLVIGSRTPATALAGLGILFCGALLRTGVFGATVSSAGTLLRPQRLAASLVLTAGWIVWLLLAEQLGAAAGVGSVAGVAVATAVLAGILTVQFSLEQRVFRRSNRTIAVSVTPILPSVLLAAGAGALLASAWFTEWSVVLPPLSIGLTSVTVWIDALHLGVLVFLCCSFLAHQRRFQLVLDG